jgi:hypothetical protein
LANNGNGRRNRRRFCYILLHRIVAVELNYLQDNFNNLIQSLQPYPRPTPSEEVTRVQSATGCIHRSHTVGGANGTTMVVMFVGLLCWGLLYFLYYFYCRNPTVWEFFVPAGTLVAVKLLIMLKLFLGGALNIDLLFTPQSSVFQSQPKTCRGIIHTTTYHLYRNPAAAEQNLPPPCKKNKVDTTLTRVENPQRRSPYACLNVPTSKNHRHHQSPASGRGTPKRHTHTNNKRNVDQRCD